MSDPSAAALFAADGPFFLIAGPCVLEDPDLDLRIARELATLSEALALPVVYKASFDKANRSSPAGERGPGIDEGLERLTRIRAESGLPVLTDIHEPHQADAAAQACDALQIPAFLCRQTDLIQAAAATGRPLNLKKGQWMSPEAMAGAVAKVRTAGSGGIVVTERGTFFGYDDLVVDMRSFERIRRAAGVRVAFDGTHAVQRPGGVSGTGGEREHIPTLVRAAIAAGADVLFLEVHPEPRRAPSDSESMLPLALLRPLLAEVLALRAALDRASATEVVTAGHV